MVTALSTTANASPLIAPNVTITNLTADTTAAPTLYSTSDLVNESVGNFTINPIDATTSSKTHEVIVSANYSTPAPTSVSTLAITASTSASTTMGTTSSPIAVAITAIMDREATYMALEKASALLEPPKELFQQIHSDLAVIRSSFANVSDIKYVSNWVPGKLLCKQMNERAVQRLNQSEFGPVKEDRTEHYTALTFAKPYNTPVLINKLKENGLLEDSYECRVDGIIDGKSNIIYNYDKTFTFHKNLGDCALTCADKHYWTFEVKNGTAILIKESET